MSAAALILPLVLAFTGCGGSAGDEAGPGASGAGDDGGVTSAEGLRQALAEAKSGDRVVVAAGRYEGSFAVPGGVTVQGAGAETVFVSDGDGGVALSLQATSAGTSVMRVAVEGHGGGVLSKGAGAASLSEVSVSVTSGYGVAAIGGQLTLRDVSVSGQGTAGLVASQAQVVAEGLDIDVDGEFGAVLMNTGSRWTGGTVRSARVGVHVEAGDAELDGVIVRDGGGVLGAGLTIVGDAAVTTRALTVSEFDGYGVLQDGSSASHEDLKVVDNRNVGVWSQRGSDVEIRGAGTSVMRNSGAAVYGFQTRSLHISGGLFADTAMRPTVVGGARAAQVGDGLQLLDATGTLTLESARFEDHPRAGLLLHGGSNGLQVSVGDVTVSTTGGDEEAVATVVQGGAPDAVASDLGRGVRAVGQFAAAGTSVMTVLEPVASESLASPFTGGQAIGDDGMLITDR